MPRDQLRVRDEGRGLGTYTFNSHAIAHRFCQTCGIHPYAEDAGSAAERSAYVNARCLEGVDVAALSVIEFDGRAM